MSDASLQSRAGDHATGRDRETDDGQFSRSRSQIGERETGAEPPRKKGKDTDD